MTPDGIAIKYGDTSGRTMSDAISSWILQCRREQAAGLLGTVARYSTTDSNDPCLRESDAVALRSVTCDGRAVLEGSCEGVRERVDLAVARNSHDPVSQSPDHPDHPVSQSPDHPVGRSLDHREGTR